MDTSSILNKVQEIILIRTIIYFSVLIWTCTCIIVSHHLYRLYEDQPDDSIEKCALLLDEPSLDTAIRVGDVYGMMIEHYTQTGNHQKVNFIILYVCLCRYVLCMYV